MLAAAEPQPPVANRPPHLCPSDGVAVRSAAAAASGLAARSIGVARRALEPRRPRLRSIVARRRGRRRRVLGSLARAVERSVHVFGADARQVVGFFRVVSAAIARARGPRSTAATTVAFGCNGDTPECVLGGDIHPRVPASLKLHGRRKDLDSV